MVSRKLPRAITSFQPEPKVLPTVPPPPSALPYLSFPVFRRPRQAPGARSAEPFFESGELVRKIAFRDSCPFYCTTSWMAEVCVVEPEVALMSMV